MKNVKTVEEAVFKYPGVSEPVIEGLFRYVEHKIPTGSFLRAVLENNLSEAAGRADETNAPKLKEIMVFIYNQLPADSWGDPGRVSAWLKKGDSQ